MGQLPIHQHRHAWLNALRQLEADCYSICLYLLQDAQGAFAVAAEVISELAKDSRLLTSPPQSICERELSKRCMRQVLHYRQRISH